MVIGAFLLALVVARFLVVAFFLRVVVCADRFVVVVERIFPGLLVVVPTDRAARGVEVVVAMGATLVAAVSAMAVEGVTTGLEVLDEAPGVTNTAVGFAVVVVSPGATEVLEPAFVLIAEITVVDVANPAGMVGVVMGTISGRVGVGSGIGGRLGFVPPEGTDGFGVWA